MMKKSTKFLLLFLCLTGAASPGYAMPRIKRGGGDFKDLVTKSTVFADKSLLIKDIIEDDNASILIAMPRRWGKSINLNMLKRFLEALVDDNGKILDRDARKKTDNHKIFHEEFVLQPDKSKKQLAISQTKICISDSEDIFNTKKVDALDIQGTYPVIYIDFKNCKAGNYEDVKKRIRSTLSRSFRQHAYLKNSSKLTQRQRELVNQYIEESNDTLIEDSLLTLSDALYHHHQKKVWILVDEYDAVANVAYREFSDHECKKIIELFQGIYEAALKTNEDYLEKGVLTGVQYIAKSGMLSGLNNLGKFDFTSAKYAQHYGLDQSEVNHFFSCFRVPEKMADEAKQWYDGYNVPRYFPDGEETSQFKIVEKYNIWSIVSYLLCSRDNNDFSKLKSHWEDSGNIAFLRKLFREKAVREQVEQLVHGESIYLEREDDFLADDFKVLREIENLGDNIKITTHGLNILFSYLFIGGYLTINKKGDHYYCLPNMEITHEMEKRLITYYETLFTVSPEKIQEATNVLQEITDRSNPDDLPDLLQHFYNKFQVLVRSIRLVNNKDEKGVFINEDIIHSMLNYIAFQTKHTTIGSEMYTRKIFSGEKGRADLKMTKHNVGIIMEVKCVEIDENNDTHIKEALKQAQSYGNLLEGIENRLFLAINVDKKKSEPEERDIELWCATGLAEDAQTIKINAKGQFVESNKKRRVA